MNIKINKNTKTPKIEAALFDLDGTLLNSKEQILMNEELMQLDDPDIIGNIKMYILDRFDEEVTQVNKVNIMKVLVKYKVTDAFGKNFNDWLRDTFGNIITK